MDILNRYGIKEVADVTFYEIKDGQPGKPVLYLDTLKMSVLGQSSQNTESRGGKGNAAFVSWDYEKEVTFEIEDALFSGRSLEVMYGGRIEECHSHLERYSVLYLKDSHYPLFITDDGENYFTAASALSEMGFPWEAKGFYVEENGIKEYGYGQIIVNDVIIQLDEPIPKQDLIKAKLTTEDRDGDVFLNGGEYLYYIARGVRGTSLDISAETYPGIYYVTGDTFVRNEVTGKDEMFQIILPKVKVISDRNTIEMEADGQPVVFNMTIKALKGKGQPLMSFIQYEMLTTKMLASWIYIDPEEEASSSDSASATIPLTYENTYRRVMSLSSLGSASTVVQCLAPELPGSDTYPSSIKVCAQNFDAGDYAKPLTREYCTNTVSNTYFTNSQSIASTNTQENVNITHVIFDTGDFIELPYIERIVVKKENYNYVATCYVEGTDNNISLKLTINTRNEVNIILDINKSWIGTAAFYNWCLRMGLIIGTNALFGKLAAGQTAIRRVVLFAIRIIVNKNTRNTMSEFADWLEEQGYSDITLVDLF